MNALSHSAGHMQAYARHTRHKQRVHRRMRKPACAGVWPRCFPHTPAHMLRCLPHTPAHMLPSHTHTCMLSLLQTHCVELSFRTHTHTHTNLCRQHALFSNGLRHCLFIVGLKSVRMRTKYGGKKKLVLEKALGVAYRTKACHGTNKTSVRR